MLWPSTVQLSHEFFASLSRHAIPLDNRAVGAIANSPIALDAYVWLAQRLHRVSPDKPQFIGWATVYEQFGQGYNRSGISARSSLRSSGKSEPSTPEPA